MTMTSTSCLYMKVLFSLLFTCWGFWWDRFLVWSAHKESPRLSLGREDLWRKRIITRWVRYMVNRSPGHHKTWNTPFATRQQHNNMETPTFDNTVELFHVVVCFAVVHHCSDGEDQLGLYLRESIKHTLTEWKWNKLIKRRQKLQIPAIQAVVLWSAWGASVTTNPV